LLFQVIQEGSSNVLCNPKLASLDISEIQADGAAPEKIAKKVQEFGSINSKGKGQVADSISRGDVVTSEAIVSRTGATFRNTEYPDIKVSCPQTSHVNSTISDIEGPCVLVRPCYTDLLVGNLDKPFEHFDDGSFDVVLCVGTTSYVTDYSNLFSEWCRILKKNGVAIFTIRTVLWDSNHLECSAFAKRLEEEGKWNMVHKSEPCPYMPKNPIREEREKTIYYIAFAT